MLSIETIEAINEHGKSKFETTERHQLVQGHEDCSGRKKLYLPTYRTEAIYA